MLAHTCAHSTESKSRILYLGNDLKLIAAVRQELTEPEYRLVACSDRESAILFLKSKIPYDALLIDLEWREAEGLALARLAHTLRHLKRKPIILVSTKSNNQMKTVARKAGVTDWVTKTPDIGTVSKAIRQIIED